MREGRGRLILRPGIYMNEKLSLLIEIHSHTSIRVLGKVGRSTTPPLTLPSIPKSENVPLFP